MKDYNTMQAIKAGEDSPNFWNCEIIANLFDTTDSKIVLLWTNRDNGIQFEAELLTDELGKDSTKNEIEDFCLRNWSKFHFKPTLPF